jgi:hypothetical protein
VLVLLQAAEQDGVHAEQLAQRRQDLVGVGRPDLAGPLDLGQGQGPVPAGQQHRRVLGMDHHEAQARAPATLVHDRTIARPDRRRTGISHRR